MAIMIREFVENCKAFASNVGNYRGGLDFQEAAGTSSNVDAIVPDSLMVEIEGVHAAPFVTRNSTRYTASCLENSVKTWTQPYRRPLIKHHNEKNGEPIGRIVAVEYVTKDTRSGTPALRFTANIPDAAAKEGVRNGLLSTVSIGIIAHDVRCSICGSPITDAEEGCPNGHERGSSYETDNGIEEVCYWDIHEMEAKELSYVDVPSDMYAKNVDYYPAQKEKPKNTSITESLDNNILAKGEQNMPKDNDQTVALTEAKAKVTELEKQVAELTEAKTASESKTAELSESVEKLTAQVAELTEAKAALEEAAKESDALKESMEKEIADSKAALKESMVDMYLTLRESMGNKVENAEAIKERPVESLKYSIIDLKESFNASTASKDDSNKKVPPAVAGSVADPTLHVDITESNGNGDSDEPVDLQAGIKNIFSRVISARN